jgi:two-component system cell cycle sensor histidine kinase/response regulator CckA
MAVDDHLYRHLVANNPDFAILVFDDARVLQSWNAGAEALFGWTAEEVLGKPADLIFTPEDREKGIPDVEHTMARDTGRSLDERWHVRKDGSRLWASGILTPIRGDDGSVLAWSKIVRDATLTKRAVDQQTASERRYRLLADTIPQLVMTGHAHALEYANRRWDQYTGVPEDRWREVVHPDDLGRLEAHWRSTGANGQAFELELRIRRARDGAWRWFHAQVVPMPNGTPGGWLASATDIQDRRDTEEAVRHAQKLESIGVLAGGIAHDFNNLLTGILGNASLALRKLPPDTPPRIRKQIEDVQLAGERAAGLTRQLLAYAGRGRLHLAPVNVSGATREMGELIRAAVPHHVQLEIDTDPDCPAVMGDSAQIHQLLMNLIINAAEAVGDRPGTVRVEVGCARLEPRPTDYPGFALEGGTYVRLCVRDDGVGMDAETISRMFDPFFTTKFTGRGLGLAAVLGIVRGHRGGIRVQSTPGVGTSFEVVLPAEVTEAPRELRPQAAPVVRSDRTVLIVDDEDVVREAATAILEEAGYRVRTATNGQEAVDRIEAGERPDLVLLDLTMPVLSGEAALQRMRLVAPELRVVMMSGFGEGEAADRFVGQHLDGFLQKPFAAEALQATVARALESAAPSPPAG